MPKLGRIVSPMAQNNDPLYAPPPVARVKPEAEAIATKSRGSMEKWLRVDDNINSKYKETRPVARAPTSAARQSLQKSRGTMNQYVGSDSEHLAMKVQNKHPGRTVKSEAAENASGNKGRGMSNLMTKYGNLTPSARPVARLKPEAEDIAAGHRGRSTAMLFHSYGNLDISSRVPRVKPEANEVYEKYQKGTGINKLIHQERSARMSNRPGSARSASTEMFNPRPKSPEERKHESYQRRNGTTLVTTWK